jgi:regulatory protein
VPAEAAADGSDHLPKRRLSCHERALRLLSVRARSRRELQTRLLAAGFESEEVERILDRLEAAGLVDDADFAAQVVDHAVRSGRSGRRAVRSALLSKGVAPALVADALAQLGDETERAVRLASARVSRLEGLEPSVSFQRLLGFLVRRGYDLDVARTAAARALHVEPGQG